MLEVEERAASFSESAWSSCGKPRNASGWPKRCKLARAVLRKDGSKRLELAQLLGQRGVVRTCSGFISSGRTWWCSATSVRCEASRAA
jgi:hypothetical protein